MFSLIESKNEIAKARGKLKDSIRRDFKKRAEKNIGYPGGTEYGANVFTDGSYWYWPSDDQDAANPRFLNWFGLFNPESNLQISVEINTPYKGRNDQVAGFFARDNDTGSIYLFHTGRVGGGTKGVGKTTFLAWSDMPLINIVDSAGNVKEGVLVMPVEGHTTTRSAIRYIASIVKFKKAVREGELTTPQFQFKQKEFDDYYAEARGRRKGRRSAEIDYLSRHGEVVDELYLWRVSQPLPKGARVVKSRFIDLGVSVGNNLIEVFEVKTSSVRCDIYSGIGQLMVHGLCKDCKRVLVLPDKALLAPDLSDTLQRLRIELHKFELIEKGVNLLGSR